MGRRNFSGSNASNIGNNNSFLVKRKQAGGVHFSRDPLNLVNKNTRTVRKLWIKNDRGAMA